MWEGVHVEVPHEYGMTSSDLTLLQLTQKELACGSLYGQKLVLMFAYENGSNKLI